MVNSGICARNIFHCVCGEAAQFIYNTGTNDCTLTQVLTVEDNILKIINEILWCRSKESAFRLVCLRAQVYSVLAFPYSIPLSIYLLTLN